uniref:MAK10-like protein n=1 Tax=Tanacetum cinerariifolium TaxID=118510 RepID=A0A6L2JEU5_TANCI|nr:MAK10-like protein [Tanacetum cinerariifolium]
MITTHESYLTTLQRLGDENHIRTLGDYSRPIHKGYQNTIELLGCLCDPTPFGWCKTDAHSMVFGSISTWEDLTTPFLAQFFPPRRTLKLQNDILIFQQHQEDLTLYDNKSWNNPRDFAKPVKAISLPQDVPSTSDCRLIELENQVQCLMEDHLASKSSIQVNKFASSCEIYNGRNDTQYFMKNLEKTFVDYASSWIDEAGGNWFTFELEQNYLESLKIGKNGSALIQGKMPEKMKDPGLFTIPSRLGDSRPFDTLADVGSCVNLILLYLFEKLKIGPLEETNHVFGLADRTKSYPVRIVKNAEVHIGRLKLLEDFYVIDMEKDPATPLLIGRVLEIEKSLGHS